MPSGGPVPGYGDRDAFKWLAQPIAIGPYPHDRKKQVARLRRRDGALFVSAPQSGQVSGARAMFRLSRLRRCRRSPGSLRWRRRREPRHSAVRRPSQVSSLTYFEGCLPADRAIGHGLLQEAARRYFFARSEVGGKKKTMSRARKRLGGTARCYVSIADLFLRGFLRILC